MFRIVSCLWTYVFHGFMIHGMRVYEVIFRSGAKAEITAEILHDEAVDADKIYFYRDKAQKQLVAYFFRNEIAGIILGPDNSNSMARFK